MLKNDQLTLAGRAIHLTTVPQSTSDPVIQNIDYPFRGPPVTIRVMCKRHLLISCRVIEQGIRFMENPSGIGANQFHRTGFKRLGSFRGIPNDQNWLTVLCGPPSQYKSVGYFFVESKWGG